MFLIRAIIGVSLLIIGTLLNEGYKNFLYLYWLVVLVILFFSMEYLLNHNSIIKRKLQETTHKVSTLTILKGTKNDIFQISILPKERIVAGKVSTIDIYATSALPLNKKPDLKLLTKSEWEITLSTQRQKGEQYADSYEYILVNPIIRCESDRYIHCSFDIKINNPGQHEFIILLDNGEIKGKSTNLITVNRS